MRILSQNNASQTIATEAQPNVLLNLFKAE